MSDLIRLVHPDLPGREVETTRLQSVPLRKIGWVDAPPKPPAPKKSTTKPAPAPSDSNKES